MPHLSVMGLAPSYGAGEGEVLAAYAHGVTFFFWGALRLRSFGAGIRRLPRERITIAVQTFTHRGFLLRPSVDAARMRLRTDFIDVLCLAFREHGIEPRVFDAARSLVDRGVVRSLMVSAHDRARIVSYANDFDALMVRYNAAHRGAEDSVFPFARNVVAYTATRWGSLVGPMRASDCYRFVLSNPSVTSCLCAPSNRAELDEALLALDRGPMTSGELAEARRIGDSVRAQKRSAPPFRKRDYVAGVVRSIRDHGLTEDVISRFNR
jgi:aryl-alcohol dehydrogenase-like predicted oxidoreductase